MGNMPSMDVIESAAKDCNISISGVFSFYSGLVTVGLVDDGRVRINVGDTALFLSSQAAELPAHELISASVRAQLRAESVEA